jgi:hypothetical protein
MSAIIQNSVICKWMYYNSEVQVMNNTIHFKCLTTHLLFNLYYIIVCNQPQAV